MINLSEKLKLIYRLQDTLPKLIGYDYVLTQKVDEYDIALQIFVYNQVEKQVIKVNQMFNQINDDIKIVKLVDKVLFAGRAGIGKTTFIDHITYEWSKDKIYGDKFDHIFKVSFKKLASKYIGIEIIFLRVLNFWLFQ